MSVAKLDLEVEVSKEMIDDPSGIYMIHYRIEWGKEGAFASGSTVYCYRQHDLSINMLMSDHGLQRKRIKLIALTALKKVGESVAVTQPIKRWGITNEKAN
jgi:hypothetical protein